VGGGGAAAGGLLPHPARRAYSATRAGRAHRERVRFVLAGLGNRAGIVGAADLARWSRRPAGPHTWAPSSSRGVRGTLSSSATTPPMAAAPPNQPRNPGREGVTV